MAAIAVAMPFLLLPSAPSLAQSAEPVAPLEARVLISPQREATLSSDLAGRIAAMPVKDGARFAKGDVLVQFACDLHEATLAEERAGDEAARATLANRKELAALRSTGELDVALAAAEAKRSAARVALQRGMVERCTVRAPYDGRVVERLVQPHETVSAGTPVLSILDDSALELEMVVPSSWLRWLRQGAALSVMVDETGTTHPAVVSSIGARIDAVSQVVAVKGAFEKRPEGLLAGMSGTAVFAPVSLRPGGGTTAGAAAVEGR
ncbi:efflux RND transporter periplasmic adaptor subunit [Novispirillum sp. DQ9]|uniref:efflux RND transporter periplasmic adaptor subunit n=1 Tax=Novispirillum sp. DQ9 TaxID=3398612 RepID=UPI003C7DAB94